MTLLPMQWHFIFCHFFQMFNIWISQRFGLNQISIHTSIEHYKADCIPENDVSERIWLFEIYKDLMIFLSIDLEDLACITLKLLNQGNESILSQFKISKLTCKATKQIETAFLDILLQTLWLFVLILKIWSV